MDSRSGAEHRAELLAGATGAVGEVGAGQGLNFAHYPATVTGVTAVEPDPTLRAAALVAAGVAPVPVTVAAGTAEALPLPAGSVDVVVLSLVLCSVPDPLQALAEARRVLTPGGRLLVYEHVRSRAPLIGWLQHVATPVWTRMAGGCHLDRDATGLVELAGWTPARQRRFGFSPARGLPPVPHVLSTTGTSAPAERRHAPAAPRARCQRWVLTVGPVVTVASVILW